MLSPFRYPGGKNKLLPKIVPFIEQSIKETHKFCDAFIGGGSVLLEIATKFPNIELFCNDKDFFVYCFWKIASSNKTELDGLFKLIKQKPTIDLYYKLRENAPTSEVEAAYRAIFFNRTSFSGDMRHGASPIGGKNQQSKYTVDCRYNSDKIIKKIEIIHKLLHNRIIISNLDINNYHILNDNTVTTYLDPPYWVKGKMLYEEYMKDNEHIVLSSLLKKRNNWILSYDNCSHILDLYDWANIHFIDASYCIRGNKKNWHKTKEVLIIP